MRRLSKDGLAFHAHCPPITTEAFGLVVEAAESQQELPVLGQSQDHYPSWQIGKSQAPLCLTLNPTAPWSELHVSIEDPHLEEYGAERLVRLLAWLSDEIGARLGRTTPVAAPGFVNPAELDGDVAFVDWFQYWAEPIIRRWGIPRLASGPFHRVEVRRNDACLLLLTAEPDDPMMSRQSAASYLGIDLPPIYTQIVPGKRIQVPWR